MRRKDIYRIIPTIIISVFIICSGSSFAQPGGKKGLQFVSQGGTMSPHPFMLRWDKNGDGKVAKEGEFAGRRNFNDIDLNKDGYIDANEVSQLPMPGGKTSGKGHAITSPYLPDEIRVYKTVNGIELKVHIFLPPDKSKSDKRPALAYFHGGAWSLGQPEMGYEMCEYFASRGVVAFSFSYRLVDNRTITPVECVTDAKSAIRWVRAHAGSFNIDPEKIIASGSSSGGHMAACTGILEGFEEKGEDLAISSVPNAMILRSAVLNPAVEKPFISMLQNRTRAEGVSPQHNIRRDLAPSMIIHGSSDDLLPPSSATIFVDKMQKAGNRSELHIYEGAGHGPNSWTREQTDDALSKMIQFLISLGFLKGR